VILEDDRTFLIDTSARSTARRGRRILRPIARRHRSRRSLHFQSSCRSWPPAVGAMSCEQGQTVLGAPASALRSTAPAAPPIRRTRSDHRRTHRADAGSGLPSIPITHYSISILRHASIRRCRRGRAGAVQSRQNGKPVDAQLDPGIDVRT